MPEELLTKAEWDKRHAIEELTAKAKSIDLEIEEIGDRMALEIQALEERKTKLTEEIKKLGG